MTCPSCALPYDAPDVRWHCWPVAWLPAKRHCPLAVCVCGAVYEPREAL